MEAISFSHAGVLNVTEVSRESEVNRNRVESYVRLLEDWISSCTVPTVFGPSK